MDKRTLLFLVLSLLVLTVYFTARAWLIPPPPVVAEVEEPPVEDPARPAIEPVQPGGGEDEPPTATEEQPAESEKPLETKRVAVGSLDMAAPYRLLVTFSSKGGTIERIELADPKFRDLENRAGYLGQVAPIATPRGLKIGVVGAGTPAAIAGITAGDILVSLDGESLLTPDDLTRSLHNRKPGEEVKLVVEPGQGGPRRTVPVELSARPLELIHPENDPHDPTIEHPLSFQLALAQNGDKAFASFLRNAEWETKEIPEGVEFSRKLSETQLAEANRQGSLEVVKRYRLLPISAPGSETETETNSSGYSLHFEIEIRNAGDTAQPAVAYMLDGPTGLPLEGWWYSYKVATGWSAGGARDVVGRSQSGAFVMQICSAIVKNYENDKPNDSDLLNAGEKLDFLGGDTQYFCAVLIAANDANAPVVQRAFARPVSELDPINKSKRTDVSFRFVPQGKILEPGESLKHSFVIFAGPKQPELLARHEISTILQYGWFGPVARLMLLILHTFHAIVPNYGIAIILLTVMVRGLMLPIGRQAAKNAQMMQVMAPELAKIKEKYKTDLQKQGQAQQELFRKYKYNPMTGCLLMFLQLPVFIGLYRGLAVDIELRQAPLIPGLDWASNLAGPDMLWRWDAYLPEFLAGENGYLGPYLNVLPLVTVALFVVQQKLFTPPATDEQTKMQQQVMMFMTIFIGFLFFRVPAGLCLYFIVSSLWGVSERLLLPKPKLPSELTGGEPAPKSGLSKLTDRLTQMVSGSSNGEPKKGRSRRSSKKR